MPNCELFEYWTELATKFDQFVQLSESVEGSLLALQGRSEYKYTYKKLHRLMNRNYLGQTHRIAGVPMPPRPKFYPSKSEIKRADEFLEGLNCEKTILWTLSGSSVHKAYPYTDNILAKIFLQIPGVKVIFVGDELCQLLELPWAHEVRVVKTCGRLNIRDTLTLAQRVDLVIGPETGVLNCVAYEDNYKIMMLSHSSIVNIGNNWKNASVFAPKGVRCYPCHKIHNGWSTCSRDEHTGAAACAAGISPYKIYDTIKRRLAA